MAIAVAIQTLVWIGVAVAAFMAYREVARTLDRLERDAVAPLVARAHTTLEKVEDATARIRAVDDKMHDLMSQTGRRAARVVLTARSALWPLVGIGRSAVAAIQAFNHPRRPGLAASSHRALGARQNPPRLP